MSVNGGLTSCWCWTTQYRTPNYNLNISLGSIVYIELEHNSIKVAVMTRLGWLTDDRSRLKDTLCSHFPSSKIVNLWRFNFQLEPITISREVFPAITEPGVTVPATDSLWQPH